jgi:hypothetical protein
MIQAKNDFQKEVLSACAWKLDPGGLLLPGDSRA